MKLSMTFGALACAVLSAGAVQAGPAADDAMGRIRAIAAGDVEAIMADYAEGVRRGGVHKVLRTSYPAALGWRSAPAFGSSAR